MKSMRSCIHCLLLTVVVALIIFGCSSSGNTPPNIPATRETLPKTYGLTTPGRVLWGAWNLDSSTGFDELKLAPVREIDAHFNITAMLKPPACAGCIQMSVLEYKPLEKYIKLKFTIENPGPMSGFDVRGIAVSNAPGFELNNADAYTGLWDDGVGPLVNPFKAFATDQPFRAINPGTSHARVYEINYPSFTELLNTVFIVDASWPANCKEPYDINNFQQNNSMPSEGGIIEIHMDVLDWQNDVDDVVIEMGAVGGGAEHLFKGSGDEWYGNVSTEQVNADGVYKLRVRALSAGSQVVTYDYVDMTVSSCTYDDNQDASHATILPIGSVSGAQSVCPDDKEDWFKFEVINHVYGVVKLTLTNDAGPVDLTLYSDPGAEYLLWGEASFGNDAALDTTPLLLGPGWYYLRVRHLGTDEGKRNYILQNLTEDSTCFPDGNDSYQTAINIPIGVTIADEYVCQDDKQDWFDFIYDNSGDNTVITLTVTSDTGPVDLTLYNEAQASNPDGPHSAWVQTESEASFKLDNLGIPDGHYYLRARHIGSDADVREYSVSYSTSGGGWGVSWGGSPHDEVYTVQADDNGNVYVSGMFTGTSDFDPGPGVEEHTSEGGLDAFLSKFDGTGNFQWVKIWKPGTGLFYDPSLKHEAMAYNGSGKIYMTGFFNGTVDFDPGPGVHELTCEGSADAYVLLLNTDGEYLGAVRWGGQDTQRATDIAIDSSGYLNITGYFQGLTDFDPGPGIHGKTASYDNDMFLLKLDPSGNFEWVYTRGNNEDAEIGKAVSCDASGNVYVAGDSPEIYLIKVSESGAEQSMVIWPYQHKGLEDMVSDPSGGVYLTGWYNQNFDFDPGLGLDIHESGNADTTFLIKMHPDLTYDYGFNFNGTSENSGGRYIELDGVGNLYLAGTFAEYIDLNPGPVEDARSIGPGNRGLFLVKFTSGGEYIWGDDWAMVDGGPDNDIRGLSVNPGGYAFLPGVFDINDFDLDPGPGVDYHSTTHDIDAFLIKLNPLGTW